MEFRRRVGAEPFVADAALDAHGRECEACARYRDELRAMDGLIRRSLAVELRAPAAAPSSPPRRRLFAIAASIAAGVAVGLVVLVGAPRQAIAREVVAHVRHEPGTMDLTAPLAPATLAGVLDPSGLRLRPGAGEVTFAARCVFDGHIVPHLVVRTPEGPVTVLLLAHRSIGEPMRFDEHGYAGVVLPAPRGAVAVVGQGVVDLDGAARKVFDAIDWSA